MSEPTPDQPLAQALAARAIELADRVGEGAAATVYRALDRKHDRPLAVKVLKSTVPAEFGAERFANEIRISAQLRHPGILPLIDSGQTADGRVYYLMPFAEGETLRARLARGPLPPADAIRIATEVAEALAFAHRAGYVHRDVKPDNILIEAGRAVLADFGLARRIATTPDQPAYRTQPGIAVGTPAYMSPEQLAGEPTDGRSDVYALAVVCYEMLTGRSPFGGTGTLGMMAARFDPAVSHTEVLTPVPAALRPVLRAALALDPAGRPTAAEFEAALRAITSGASALGPPTLLRQRWTPVRLAGLALVVAAGLWFALRPTPLDPRTVLVADFANETGDPSLDRIGPIAGDWISAALTPTHRLTILNGAFILGAPRRDAGPTTTTTVPGRLRAVADSSGAGTVVTGSVYGSPAHLELFAEVLDARSGRLLGAVGPLTGRMSALDSLMASLRTAVVPIVTATVP